MTEMLKTSETTEKLLKFIDASPSCFHAVKNICVMLEDAGCIRLLENETWALEKGKRYFTTRNGSSVLAFSVPENYNGMQIVSAHSDSPTFRVKSGAEIIVEGHYKKLNTEGYGGMILSTWFDRPLSLAGRAVVRTESGVKSVLLNIDRDLCIIPSLAIHMTRGMADHKLNPQVDLLPLLGGENADYNALIAEEAGVKKEDVISSDMFLYPRQHGVVFGMENEFIASPRLDDLQCAFSATEAFLNAENKEKLLISAVFGFCVGIASGILDDLDVGVWLTDGLIRLLTVIAPWGIPISSVVLLGICLWHYRSAKSLFDRWDGEDDSAPEEADRKLNVVVLCSTLAMILDLFFLAVGVVYIDSGLQSLLIMGELVLSLIPVTLAQQKTVDLTRRMNPEKQVSVYDTKFQEKWYEVCDEAERAQIGQASFRAFRTVNVFCPFLWMALLFLSFVFPIGLMPMVAVLLVWVVLEVSYIFECMRLAKQKARP